MLNVSTYKIDLLNKPNFKRDPYYRVLLNNQPIKVNTEHALKSLPVWEYVQSNLFITLKSISHPVKRQHFERVYLIDGIQLMYDSPLSPIHRVVGWWAGLAGVQSRRPS